jgi:putative radical SAM enzyme (TIGR03279 family)
VDQLPRGLRRSLYFKDEDYRLSFLHGNYVTLTNLSEQDGDRIARQRLSPLYISVHSTDPEIRRFLLGNPQAPDLMSQLRRLAQSQIEMHLQVVICPGLNDGPSLEKTIQDLSSLRPFARSLSLVPVGLTAHRQGLFPLCPMDALQAEEVVELSRRWRRRFIRGAGEHLLHLSDEIYLLAGRPFPSPRTYDGYPQLENGVGMASRFIAAFCRREKTLPPSVEDERRFLLLTGELAFPLLRPIVDRLNEIHKLQIEAIPIRNSLFGSRVTVAGLLAGKDLVDGLKGREGAADVLIPESALRYQGKSFLDGLSLPQISRTAGRRILPVRDSIADLLRILLQPGRN